MSTRKRIDEFKKRWDITDLDYVSELNNFKNRVINIFSDIDQDITLDGIKLFCQIMGIREKWDQKWSEYRHQYVAASKMIISELHGVTEEKKMYYILEVVFMLHFNGYRREYKGKDVGIRDMYYHQLCDALELSNINLSISKNNEEIIFYPRGEKILDNHLVEETLKFLNIESNKHFIDALRFYQNYNNPNSIRSAESVRRSVEEFLRYKLQNAKGLQANLLEIQKKLKEDKRDPFIRKIIYSAFDNLDSYFNENSKHKDGDIKEEENEFLIYQAGALMRYINKALK